jgi:hypothetical protein
VLTSQGLGIGLPNAGHLLVQWPLALSGIPLKALDQWPLV